MSRRIPRLRRPGGTALENEVREEVETHVAMWIEHLVARGVSREEAERSARARFGEFTRRWTTSTARHDIGRIEWNDANAGR